MSLPRQAAIVLLLAIAVPALRCAAGREWSADRDCWLEVTVGAFALYLLLNALWADDVARAVGKALTFGCFFGCAYLGTQTINDLNPASLRTVGIGMCLGLALAALYLLIDMTQSRLIWAGIRIAFLRILTGAPSGIGPYGTSQQYVYPQVLNVDIAVFASLLFPVLLMGSKFIASNWQRHCLLLAVALGLALVLLSEHEASKAAVAVGGVTFLLWGFAPAMTRVIIIVAWIAATLFVVPITQTAYGLGLHRAQFVQPSGRARIVLWKYTGDKVKEAPLLGIGIGSTAARRAAEPQVGEVVPGTDIFLGITSHAHNVFLQAWVELGAIGAAFLLGTGLLVLAAIGRQPIELQPFLSASFVATSTLAGLSFNLFAEWWIATILLTGLAARLGLRLRQS